MKLLLCKVAAEGYERVWRYIGASMLGLGGLANVYMK